MFSQRIKAWHVAEVCMDQGWFTAGSLCMAGDLFSPRNSTYYIPIFRQKMMFGPFYFLEHYLACPSLVSDTAEVTLFCSCYQHYRCSLSLSRKINVHRQIQSVSLVLAKTLLLLKHFQSIISAAAGHRRTMLRLQLLFLKPFLS